MDFLLAYSPLLAYKALREIADIDSREFPDLLRTKKQLCLGVPLGYYHKRHNLQSRLTNYTISTDFIRFDSVEVRAQGQGILFDYVLDENGKPIEDHINQNVLILDIGFNTVDVLGVVEGRPSREWSDMLENGGICRICGDLRSYLKREFNFNLSEQAVKEVLQNGQISVYGDSKDLSTAIRKIRETYSDWLVQEIKSRWEDFLIQADKLIIAGGGAYYVEEIRKAYPERFIHIPEASEYSNARGFFKFLRAR
jgi:plasmid segregation protein ParM